MEVNHKNSPYYASGISVKGGSDMSAECSSFVDGLSQFASNRQTALRSLQHEAGRRLGGKRVEEHTQKEWMIEETVIEIKQYSSKDNMFNHRMIETPFGRLVGIKDVTQRLLFDLKLRLEKRQEGTDCDKIGADIPSRGHCYVAFMKNAPGTMADGNPHLG